MTSLVRLARRAHACDATAPNLFRVVAEVLRGEPVEASAAEVGELDAPLFGFSPVWLLAALETGSSQGAAGLDREELDASLAELQAEADALPLAAVHGVLIQSAAAEGRAVAEVSEGIGLAFLVGARRAPRPRLDVPVREEWRPREGEGFAAYGGRVGGPFRDAVVEHADAERPTWTERLVGRVSRDI